MSGVVPLIPKVEYMKEDYAKVLTDWQEHIGFLQATEAEEDIDLVSLDLGLQIAQELQDDIFENSQKYPNATIEEADAAKTENFKVEIKSENTSEYGQCFTKSKVTRSLGSDYISESSDKEIGKISKIFELFFVTNFNS